MLLSSRIEVILCDLMLRQSLFDSTASTILSAKNRAPIRTPGFVGLWAPSLRSRPDESDACASECPVEGGFLI